MVCTDAQLYPDGAVVRLADAIDAGCAGAKAAALGRAHQAGLPVLPGFVLTPDAAEAVAAGGRGPVHDAVRNAWAELTQHGSTALVVRSSSTIEDGIDSSMAGRFESVLDVRGWDGFVDAVRAVVASGHAVHDVSPGHGGGRMAVLVQPFLVPDAGGVMFGADPVSGRRDRYVIAAVPGGPDQLVSGEVDGVTMTLTPKGKVVESSGSITTVDSHVRGLVALQQRAAAVFGGPQDVEWAIVADDVVMLQSRPITATGSDSEAIGPIFGPGPIAETFPDPLTPLERDLWVEPMADAIRAVLRITNTATAKKLAASPVVVQVDGRVAADLQLLGVEQPTGARSFFARIDPRPPVRRLKVAWSVGRLRAALPGLARDLVEEIDDMLAEVPALSDLSDKQLIALLEGSRETLRSVYGHEMLAGQLLDEESVPVTAAAAALRTLVQVREDDRFRDASDDELVAQHPVLLALVPPAIGVDVVLPPAPASMPPAADADEEQLLREALRLRGRWLQELTARAATALGRRLHVQGRLSDPLAVRALTFADLQALVRRELAFAAPGPVARDGAPLPARFRLTPDGAVVAVRDRGTGKGKGKGKKDVGGRGAGGGRACGVVLPADALPAEGAVLVVRTLDPSLASLLPGLRGLVAETGSVLSHLAILAREFGVATVVGMEDAVTRFPPGTELVVDGSTGEVTAAPSAGVTATRTSGEVAA